MSSGRDYVLLSGLGRTGAKAIVGPVRITLEVDGARLATQLEAKLSAGKNGDALRCNSRAFARLTEGKLNQPWNKRCGQDGITEVLFSLKVGQAVLDAAR